MFRRDPATRIRLLMAAQNINVSELADRAGVSRDTISRMRNDPRMMPHRDTMEMVARALGVRINRIWPGA